MTVLEREDVTRRGSTRFRNLRLRYANRRSDDDRREICIPDASPFDFEGREWDQMRLESDGFTLCVEHERTFEVPLAEGVTLYYRGPRPAEGDVVPIGRARVRVSGVVLNDDAARGSFTGEFVDPPRQRSAISKASAAHDHASNEREVRRPGAGAAEATKTHSRVTNAHRRYWLDRFTRDEIDELAGAIWPDG